MATYAPKQLHSVPLAELHPDPRQPRKYFDPLALAELTASVSQVGLHWIERIPQHILWIDIVAIISCGQILLDIQDR